MLQTDLPSELVLSPGGSAWDLVKDIGISSNCLNGTGGLHKLYLWTRSKRFDTPINVTHWMLAAQVQIRSSVPRLRSLEYDGRSVR